MRSVVNHEEKRPLFWEVECNPDDERDYILKCPMCGHWFDCREPKAVIEHYGPLPHRNDTQ